MRSVGEFGAPLQISTGFASWQRYRSDVAQRRPTRLCTMFGRVLRCYTIYTFPGTLAPWQNFARCKIHFTSKSCVFLYCQRYCTALQQRASAKLYGVVQWMELPNFSRRRHLYSTGRPSRWASAHILVKRETTSFSEHIGQYRPHFGPAHCCVEEITYLLTYCVEESLHLAFSEKFCKISRVE